MGAEVIFPAGAVSADTTFRIAVDSTGAPPAPDGLNAVGNIYVVTPHGGNFAEPVEMRIPTPAVTLQPDQLFKIAKAQPGGEWIILDDVQMADGKLRTTVRSFSYFRPVVVTYPRSLVSSDPLRFTTTLTCNGGPCEGLVGNVNASYTALSNNGQIPANCRADSLFIGLSEPILRGGLRGSTPITPAGGSRNEVLTNPDRNPSEGFGYGRYLYMYEIYMECGGVTTAFGGSTAQVATWDPMTEYPHMSVLRAPAQVDAVEGTFTDIDVIFAGGATGSFWNPMAPGWVDVVPSETDRAIVDWLRTDPGGTSWTYIATSFQDDADPLPFGAGTSWWPWRVRHSFIATAADQGAQFRVRACYTPRPPVAAVPCIKGPITRINLLQQSAFPAFVEQPRSVLIRTSQTANFSVTPSGQPSPTLRWQTRPANSTGEWTNVDAGTGATTANYTTPPRALSDNGVQYRVVATNAVGSTASSPVTVSVSDLDVAPSITTQPASLGVTNGSDAVFAVVAHGTEALSYQWRFNGAALAGANSPVLRLTGVTGANAGIYSVAVSNNAGNAVSDGAVLTVAAGAPAAVAPTIVTQPSPVTVNAGSTATLAVGIAGTGPFTFQWRRDGVDMSGATSAVLTFNSVALPNAGSYSVRVTNSAGQAVSDAVTLDVIAPTAAVAPTITSQPATLVIPMSGSGVIAVGAAGSGPLAYQWYLDGALLPGSTSPVLSFSTVSAVDFGRYTVTVSNSVSSVASQPADLILLGAPVITQQPVATTVLEGANATFFVAANGSGLRYQWSVNGAEIPGAIAPTFNTQPLVAANSGAVYSVLVYNGAGHVWSQSAVLTVQTLTAPSIMQHPADVTIAPGAQAQMCVTIGGTPTFDVQLQRWNGSSWSQGVDVLVNDNTEVCYFTEALALADTGAQYRFLVDNPAGEVASNAATVTVQSAPPPGITATTLVSAAVIGGPSDGIGNQPSISADGRHVAFTSQGTNLVPGGTAPGTESGHAFLRDLGAETTMLINRTTGGGVSSRGVVELKLSSNGRYAVFSSLAGDLVAGDTNGSLDVFRRDLQTGTTVRVNLLPSGIQLEDKGSGIFDMKLDVSGDGRWVIFATRDDMTGDGSDTGVFSLYLRDVQSGETSRVAGTAAAQIAYAAISDDGRWIAYALGVVAPGIQTINLYDSGTGLHGQVFSFEQSPAPAGLRQGISVSANGRYIAFTLNSAAITGSAADQVIVVDRDDPDALTLVSTGANGAGDGASAWPRISADGRFVLYSTNAPNLTGGLALPWREVLMVRDLASQTTSIASRRGNGTGTFTASQGSGTHAISNDGSTIAFVSDYSEVFQDPSGGMHVFAVPRP